MIYAWRPDTGVIAETFADQTEAEEWLTLHFAELRDRGIAQVTLLADDEVVYGPMGLDPL